MTTSYQYQAPEDRFRAHDSKAILGLYRPAPPAPPRPKAAVLEGVVEHFDYDTGAESVFSSNGFVGVSYNPLAVAAKATIRTYTYGAVKFELSGEEARAVAANAYYGRRCKITIEAL